MNGASSFVDLTALIRQAMRYENPPLRAAGIQGLEQVDALAFGQGAEILRTAHIDPSDARWPEAHIPYKAVISLLEHVADRHAVPDLGLRLAHKQDATVLGALGVAIQNARTLRESVDLWEKHLHFHSPACELHVERPRPNQLFFCFDIAIEKIGPASQTFELSLRLTQKIAQSLLPSIGVSYDVWFKHLPVGPLSSYENAFGVTPRFGMPRTGLMIGGCDLDQPIPTHNEVLRELAAYYLDTKQPAAARTTRQRTRATIARIMDSERCTQAKVAASMFMTVRTLQRRLRDEGTGFDQIVDEIRQERAENYLRQTETPIAKIADLLHFKEPSAFTHACHRWFGAAPKAVRRRLAGDDPLALPDGPRL